MVSAVIRRFRRFSPGILAASLLLIPALSGCSNKVEEGTLQEEQAPEITDANNAMMDYAKTQGKTKD